MRLLIAREAVDQHLSVAGALADPKAKLPAKLKSAPGAIGFYAKWLPQLATGAGQHPKSYSEMGEPLAGHLRFVERASRKLARSTFYGMARWQAKLEKKQGFLGRLVDIGAELYAMSACCVRARMLLDDGSPEGKSAVELADLFCQASRRRTERLFADLWANDDVGNYKAAQRVLAGDYTWVEGGIIDPADL
jgi:hypothetical protein